MCRVACAGRGEVLIPGPCPGTAAGYHGRSAAFRAEVMVKKKDSIRISQENIVHYCNVLLKISQKVRNWLRIAKNLMTAKIQPLTAEIQQLTAKIKELTAKIQQLTPKGQTADNQNLAADCHKN